ncbi:MAG: DsbC family protein [Gammaproteobacteria bacterium]
MNRTLIASAALLACAACAQAGESDLDKVRKQVVGKLPGVTAEMITPSAAPGLYQVQRGQDFGYVTKDGRYLIHGDMVDLATGEELTENQRGAARLAVVKQFGPGEVIEFAPKNPTYFITVFTDIDCGYCRKLHAEIAQYNAAGIGVRYLFYPRSGPKTPSFDQAKAVWCSTDRREALTQAKRGVHIKAPTTCKNPVERQYEAGEAIGIDATPTLILPDGEAVRGYVSAKSLAARLAMNAVAAAAAR